MADRMMTLEQPARVAEVGLAEAQPWRLPAVVVFLAWGEIINDTIIVTMIVVKLQCTWSTRLWLFMDLEELLVELVAAWRCGQMGDSATEHA